MRYTKLKEPCPWEPVCFDAGDILLLLEKAVMAEVVVRQYSEAYWIGVACEYDREKQLFGDQIFYIDDQEFASVEAFIAQAMLGGELLANAEGPFQVIDTLEGDPMHYFNLVAELKKAMGNGG